MANENLDALVRQIENLNIQVSRTQEGQLTVCTTSEPLFCYDAASEDEIRELVADTLRSYAKHFFHLDGVVSTESEPIEEDLLLERSTPVSRIIPAFDLAA